MKIWVDDVRPAPIGFIWAKSVNETFRYFAFAFEIGENIELLDLDHDAGEYFYDGGDYIKILDWMEEWEICIPIHIHSMNPVGVQNMRNIIKKNGWKEV